MVKLSSSLHLLVRLHLVLFQLGYQRQAHSAQMQHLENGIKWNLGAIWGYINSGKETLHLKCIFLSMSFSYAHDFAITNNIQLETLSRMLCRDSTQPDPVQQLTCTINKPQLWISEATEGMQVAHQLKHQNPTNHNTQKKHIFLILIFLTQMIFNK